MCVCIVFILEKPLGPGRCATASAPRLSPQTRLLRCTAQRGRGDGAHSDPGDRALPAWRANTYVPRSALAKTGRTQLSPD